VRPGINTANSPVAQLRPTSTAKRLYIVEILIGVAVAPTTAPNFYLSRSSAIGTSTLTLAGLPHDGQDGAAIGTVDSTWSANPTFSTTNYLRVAPLALTAGGGWMFTFYDDPIVIDKVTTTGIVIANVNASGATLGSFAGHFCWTE
jgi:hypothetical protein